MLLPYAVTSLTNNTDLVQITNRCGHGVSYSQLEELNTAMCLQKLAATPENMIPPPENIKLYISTSLAYKVFQKPGASMKPRHCGKDKIIFFCPVHNASTPCSLQAFGIRCVG